MKRKFGITTVLALIGLLGTVSVCRAQEPIKVEFEDFLTDSANADTGFKIRNSNDKSAVMVYPAASQDSASYTVTFTVAEAGEYDVSLLAAGYTAQNSELAKLSWSLDGTEANITEDFTVTVVDEGKGYLRSNYEWKKTDDTPGLTLSAGEHTLVLTGTKVGSGLRFALDSITFTKWEKPKPTCDILDGDTRIEVENFVPNATVNVAEASGKKVYYESGSGELRKIEIPFYAEEAGTYHFNLAAACSFSNQWISPISVVLDEGDEIKLTAENFNALELPTYHTPMTSEYRFKQLCLKNEVNISAGYHTLTILCYERSTAPGSIMAAVDFVEFRTVKDMTDLRLEVENGGTTIGTEAKIKLFNGGDLEISAADLSGGITYETADESIAYATSEGVVGVRYGVGEVTAQIQVGKTVYRAEGSFFVTAEGGLAVTAASLSGNTLSVTFRANAAYAGGDTLRVYTFGKTDQTLHSIKKSYALTVPELSLGEEKTETLTVDAESGDAVGIFLFGSDDKIAIYRQITL